MLMEEESLHIFKVREKKSAKYDVLRKEESVLDSLNSSSVANMCLFEKKKMSGQKLTQKIMRRTYPSKSFESMENLTRKLTAHSNILIINFK